MAVQTSDLTGYARIRNAALEGFARDGVAATSIRDVAKAAGVSPGLVQHHFSTKETLQEAVNEYVVSVAVSAFGELATGSSSTAVMEELGQRVAAFVGEHPTAMLYVARSAVDGDQAALRIFDAFVGIAEAQWRQLADDGLLHPDVDLTWTALHATVINLGTVLLATAVSRQLPQPLLSPEGLERWQLATAALFRRGVHRTESAEPQPAAGRRKRKTQLR